MVSSVKPLCKAASLLAFLITTTNLISISSKSILGVDLGSLYMKVALVQRNSPLEIVTNLHSKRKTEQMVLFDNEGRRLFGADASSMIGRKPLKTPTGMSIMLGRDDEHPTVKVLSERHYPLVPRYNSTRYGNCLTIDGQDFTPEELVAMVLSHAKDITAAYGAESSSNIASLSSFRDCVITVPSFYTQHERRAILDAAQLADLNVLALIDETTAAALHFGIDRVDAEPKHVLFYNMGNSAVQVSIVKFHSYEVKESKFGTKMKTVGGFQVLGKGWDSSVGGAAFDALIVDFMVEEFNAEMRKQLSDTSLDVRKNAKAMTKLRIQANKVKHVLSANNDVPIFVDSLMKDIPYKSHISRAKFEELAHVLLKHAVTPIYTALANANVTLDEIDMIELIGGGMRVPSIQSEISNVLKKELGMHINSDESMALGAAFHGANVSTAFRVRHVGMTDVNPFEIAISLEDLQVEKVEEEKKGLLGSLFGIGGSKKEKENVEATEADASTTEETKPKEESAEGEEGKTEEEEEKWSKNAKLFPSFCKVGIKKSIAFTHERDVLCALDYVENDHLPPGTELALERYNISGIAEFAKELAEKNLTKPKVTLQFELSTSGITKLIKAEAICEEMVMVDEQVEVDDDADQNVTNATVDAENAEESTAEKSETETEAKVETEAETKADAETKVDAETKTGEAAEATTEDNATADTSKEEPIVVEGNATSKTNETEKKEKPKKKKKKFITVQKEKKKVHRRTLKVTSFYIGKIQPYSASLLLESKAKLQDLAAKDQARMELEEAKNNFESYIYHVKNKLSDAEEEISKVSTEEQRTTLLELATTAEDWLYEDGFDADLETYKAKYVELSTPAEAIFFRLKEMTARPEAIAALRAKLGKVDELMTKWSETKPHITEDERNDVMAKVEKINEWIKDVEEKQSKLELFEDPVFNSTEVPLQTKSLESLVTKLSKKKPPKPAKNETKGNTTNGEDSNDTKTEEKTDSSGEKEGESSEGKEESEAKGESETKEEPSDTAEDVESDEDPEL